MSLINEALKRAQEAQKKQSPPPIAGAPLHSTGPEKSSLPWIPISIVLIVLLVAGGAFWFFGQNRHGLANDKIAIAQPRTVNQQSPPKENLQPPPIPPAEPIVATTPQKEVIAQATNIPAVTPVAPVPTNEVAPPITESQTAPSIAAVETALPKQNFKLQGIFYRPQRPSAIINGKMLFIGERVLGAQVIAITPESATLVSGGQTNVLILP